MRNATTTTLDAGYVYAMDDENAIVIGFADRKLETRHYVLLQRSKSVVAEEVKLGHDLVHISVDDEARSCFGGIQLLELDTDRVTITLDDSCARELRTDPVLRISLHAGEEQLARLRDGLRTLFAKSAGKLLIRNRSKRDEA